MPANHTSKTPATNSDPKPEHAEHDKKSTFAPARMVYTVREVAAMLGISRESVFGLLRTGQLRSILIGKRSRRVTGTQLVGLC